MNHMFNITGRSDNLANEVGELRHILTEKADASGYLKFFDEFLGEHEFGLALHAVCDYLLESEVERIDCVTLEQIEALHSSMSVIDDCVQRMRTKVA